MSLLKLALEVLSVVDGLTFSNSCLVQHIGHREDFVQQGVVLSVLLN
jgi:hypothetical protein